MSCDSLCSLKLRSLSNSVILHPMHVVQLTLLKDIVETYLWLAVGCPIVCVQGAY